MHGISYQLRLLEPLLLNGLEGDNNTAQSLHFVPGSVIRGAVIAAYLAERRRSGQAATMDAAEDGAHRLFFSGATRYLNAYPYSDRERERALPTPLSWRRKKEDEVSTSPISVFDLSLAPDNGEYQLQTIGGDAIFCVRAGESAYQVAAKRRLSLHTQRDAWIGRAVEGLGAVYRYEALQADSRLAGIILTDSPDDAEWLRQTLDGASTHLGKARTAGYGCVRFEAVVLLDANWAETGAGTLATTTEAEADSGYDDEAHDEVPTFASAETAEATNEFTVTFLSEAIVRDEPGQHTLDPLPALRRRLRLSENAEIEIARGEGQACIYRQANLVGGFNRQWNLPLPQVAAIASGSVFKVKLTGGTTVTVEQLRELRETGLGERRAEGFGRLAVNWLPLGTVNYMKLDPDFTDLNPARELTEMERTLTEQILQRLLRLDLDNLLLSAASKLDIKTHRPLPNSQLSRWRGIARSALAEKRIERLTDFHTAEKKKASASWEQMRRARVGGSKLSADEQSQRVSEPRLTDWIRSLLTQQSALEKELERLPERKLGQSLKQTVTKELEDEYRIRLLDAVLSRKAKSQAKQRAVQRRPS